MEDLNLFSYIEFSIGSFSFTSSLLTTIFISILLSLICKVTIPRFVAVPGSLQAIMEAIYQGAFNTVEELLPTEAEMIFPFIASLWIFIFTANMIGLIPGFSAPTADISVTAALAFCVYFAVHWFGIRGDGWANYLKHYLKPSPLLLPFHLISEISRTLALAIRLFGNVMSLEMAAFLILMVAGFLVPVPLLMLHIIEAIIQAYLFGMLALIYIAGGIHSRQEKTMEDS